MNQSPALRNRQKLLLTAVLFSTGGVAIKSVHMAGVQVACLRSGIAALALLLFLPGARRNWNRPVLLLSVAYACTLVSFVLANRLTTGANAIFLQDTAPLYILLLSPLVLHERPTRADLFFLLPFAVAISLFFAGTEPAVATAPSPLLGNIVAAGSGICYAVVLLGFRWLARGGNEDASVATAGLGNLLGCLGCLPFAWPLSGGRPADWWILIYLGVFQIGLAYVLMGQAFETVHAVEASLLLLLEPVLNPIWTWIAYRERPSTLALVGGGLIITATAGRTWWSARTAAE